MARLTLREASRLISGQLSATRKGNGGYEIDAAELQGVILSLPPGTGGTEMLVPKATPDLAPVLEAQIAALRAVSELLRAQLTDTREECDRLRQKAEQLALPPPAPVPVPPRRRHRRRWWQSAW
jgi:hypothetical protein